MASARVVGDVLTPVGDEKAGRQDQFSQDKVVNRVVDDARIATEKERNMTLLQGIKLYPKAIAWSVLISTTIVMEGYDVALINNFCR